MSFVHLHCHSHYSLLDGLSKIDPLVERTIELGMPALAITDHGVMYGAIEFYNKAKEAGIKPIIGLEAYIAPRSLTEKAGKVDADYYHLTLLAKNYEGYKNLMQLCTVGHLQGFYYKPRIDLEILKKYSSGIIALSGCMRGEVARAVNKNLTEGQNALEKYLSIFSKENFFIELQRNSRQNNIQEEQLVQNLYTLAKQNNLRVVATADCHYIYPEDSTAQDVLVCIGTGQTVSDINRLDMRSYDLSLKTPEQMREKFFDIPEAIENSEKIANSCELEIPINQRYFPKVKIPAGKTSKEHLKELTLQRAQELYGKNSQDQNQLPEEIKQRLDYELQIICKKGFDTYFLMVADIVEGAHKIGAITNTRGSAAGSLVGRVLGITNVDPLYYELPFERFLTEHRPTPPDIDLDIADNRRDEAIAYITENYGKDKVAQIITFGTMMARAAVRDTGRALGVSYSKCDKIAKMIPFGKQGFHMTLDKAMEMNAELKEIYNHDPETKNILDLAKKLEGCARHASVHAAGIVITPEALTEYMPLQKEPDGQRIITQYDMYTLDVNSNSKALGVIKMDLLGIRNLSILETAVKLAKVRHNVDIDIYNLPQKDKKTFELLSLGLTFGVFQMGSSGMTRYLKELKPSTIFDVMAMIALYRPGPMQFIPDYIARKHNPNLIKYLDPQLERILHRTYGILVYQDDLLTIAHDLAGYSWEEVDKFRKAVGKKIPEEMAKQKIKFISGCIKTSGFSHQKAEQIWTWIEPFAAYGFNKSHSASYAVVSYQTAYMKANFPVEFMAAVMTAESGDEDKIYEAVEECENLGIQVLPPDVNESQGDFTVVNNNTIRFGLNAIKNLGSDVITKIIEVRGGSKQQIANSRQQTAKSVEVEGVSNFDADNELGLKKNVLLAGSVEEAESVQRRADRDQTSAIFTSLQDFLIRGHVKNFNKKSWEALVKSGSLDRFGERGQLLANTEEILEFVREYFKAEYSGQNSLFGKTFQIGNLKLKQATPATTEEKLVWEKEILGLYVSAHPLDSYKKVLNSLTNIKSLSLDDLNRSFTLGGLISRAKRILTKKNDPMAFFTLEDLTANLEVVVFPKVLESCLPFVENGKIVQVSGRLSDKDEDLKFFAENITELPNDELYQMALDEMEKNKKMVLHMDTLASMEVLNSIKNVLQDYPGNVQVYLSVGFGPGLKTIKTQSLVGMNNGLITKLRQFSEISKIDVK